MSLPLWLWFLLTFISGVFVGEMLVAFAIDLRRLGETE